MKASLKFREEQKPLFKAKVPLNILGLPFQSSLLAGDSKELSLGLATFFDFGPSFRLSYRPNDAFNPFSFLIKTGIGHFGSPIDAPMSMTAEFNFLGNCSASNPKFLLHFKPQFGDFSIKKSQSSSISAFKINDAVFEEGNVNNDSSLEVVENGDYFSVGKTGGKITDLPLKSSVESAVSGMELGAKTVLPIRSGAIFKLRWGIKLPEGIQSLMKNPTARMTPCGIPSLVLNKIGIEHVAEDDRKVVGPQKVGSPGSESAELAESCFAVKRQLETLRSENVQLGKALEDLKVEFGNKGFKVRGERKSHEINGGKDVEGDSEGSKAQFLGVNSV
ncbi:COMPASS component SWD2 [Bienertia sinuspersici]